jgi:alkylglycerol monooxygenase
MDIALYAVPVLIALIVVEVVIGVLRQRQSYLWQDTATSLSMLAGNIFFNLLLQGITLGFYYWIYQFRILDISNTWGTWLLLVVLIDLNFYWFHRASHRIRVLWAVHVNHHSSEYLNLGTALRQAWFGPVVRWLFFWPLVLIGFDPLMFLSAGAVSTIAGFWVHTEQVRKMPRWFEYVFNTPSHHRVHHGSNPEYIDKNYANLFILWDRWFGSFAPEHAQVRYGLTKNIHTYNPLKVVFHELLAIGKDVKNARTRAERLRYIFSPPDWAPKAEADIKLASSPN